MKVLRKFLKKAKFPLSNKTVAENGGFLWNGKEAATGTPSNILHDFAHWQLANKVTLHLPEFGLGKAPESEVMPQKIFREFNFVYHEELFASALGIWYERLLGFDYKATMKEHSWIYNNGTLLEYRQFFKQIQKLIKLKLLSKDKKPTFRTFHKLTKRTVIAKITQNA